MPCWMSDPGTVGPGQTNRRITVIEVRRGADIVPRPSFGTDPDTLIQQVSAEATLQETTRGPGSVPERIGSEIHRSDEKAAQKTNRSLSR